jgi:hypothetical protein
MSEWHLETLKNYAESQDKTMTQAIKDLIAQTANTQQAST